MKKFLFAVLAAGLLFGLAPTAALANGPGDRSQAADHSRAGDHSQGADHRSDTAAANLAANGVPNGTVFSDQCRVTNPASAETFDTLQAAVDVAASSDTLELNGICTGRTVISTDLVIEGTSGAASGPATLDGQGIDPGVTEGGVVSIARGTTVSIDGLTITGGAGVKAGAGIGNGGALTLVDSTITGNTAGAYGGGIANRGPLTLVDSTITNNTAGVRGGGIWNFGGSVTSTNSTLTGNTPDDCWGC